MGTLFSMAFLQRFLPELEMLRDCVRGRRMRAAMTEKGGNGKRVTGRGGEGFSFCFE